MSFEVVLDKRRQKELESLDAKLKERFKQAILVLKENPVPVEEFDVVKVSGTTNTYRIRISTHRMIYDVHWKEKRIEILQIDRKKDHSYKQ